MFDYHQYAPGPESPADNAFEITIDADLPVITRAVYVGSKGDLAVRMKSGDEVTLKNVPAGTLLPIRVVKVLVASTASSLVGLY